MTSLKDFLLNQLLKLIEKLLLWDYKNFLKRNWIKVAIILVTWGSFLMFAYEFLSHLKPKDYFLRDTPDLSIKKDGTGEINIFLKTINDSSSEVIGDIVYKPEISKEYAKADYKGTVNAYVDTILLSKLPLSSGSYRYELIPDKWITSDIGELRGNIVWKNKESISFESKGTSKSYPFDEHYVGIGIDIHCTVNKQSDYVQPRINIYQKLGDTYQVTDATHELNEKEGHTEYDTSIGRIIKISRVRWFVCYNVFIFSLLCVPFYRYAKETFSSVDLFGLLGTLYFIKDLIRNSERNEFLLLDVIFTFVLLIMFSWALWRKVKNETKS